MKKFFEIFFFLVFVIFLNDCAVLKKETKPRIKRSPEITTIPEEGGSLGSSSRTLPAKSLVFDGIEAFKDKDYDLAEWNFEEAIRINPQYGPAYYWLARVYYRLENPKKALSLLKRAKEFLSDDDKWIERIEDFEEHLNQKT